MAVVEGVAHLTERSLLTPGSRGSIPAIGNFLKMSLSRPLSCFILIGVPLIEFFFHAAVSQFKTNEQRKVVQSKKYWMAASLSLLFELQWVCQDSQSNFCWTGPKVRGQCGENDLRNNQAALKKVSKKSFYSGARCVKTFTGFKPVSVKKYEDWQICFLLSLSSG